jgi:hypothetical protein
MGINNDKVSPHMISLFGEERFAKLQKEFEKEHYTSFREATIIDELSNALKEHGYHYILQFRFKNNQDKRTSHQYKSVKFFFKPA